MTTTSKEQEVVRAREDLNQRKQRLYEALAAYVRLDANQFDARLQALLAYQNRATSFFNFAENFVGDSNLLGAHKSALWAQGYAEDCAAILKSMPDHFRFLRKAFHDLGTPVDPEVLNPPETSFANMQRMVARYLERSITNDIRSTFTAEKLPTYGFLHKEKHLMSTWRDIVVLISVGVGIVGLILSALVLKLEPSTLSYTFGIYFIGLMLAIGLLFPEPSLFQSGVFRIVLSLAAAGVAAVFLGFLTVNLGAKLQAGGPLAVFAVVYFINPARFADPNGEQDAAKQKRPKPRNAKQKPL